MHQAPDLVFMQRVDGIAIAGNRAIASVIAARTALSLVNAARSDLSWAESSFFATAKRRASAPKSAGSRGPMIWA